MAATVLSPRDESTCIYLGEAAGTAAALSIKRRVKPRELDVIILQETPRSKGPILSDIDKGMDWICDLPLKKESRYYARLRLG